MAEREFKSLQEFYPYYLTEHEDATSRNLHFIGTAGVIIMLVAGLATQTWWLLALIPVCGYGFAWVGHAFFERNKPATFTYPGWSLASDFIMFYHILTGQIKDKLAWAKVKMANRG